MSYLAACPAVPARCVKSVLKTCFFCRFSRRRQKPLAERVSGRPKICPTYFELCQTYFEIQGTYFSVSENPFRKCPESADKFRRAGFVPAGRCVYTLMPAGSRATGSCLIRRPGAENPCRSPPRPSIRPVRQFRPRLSSPGISSACGNAAAWARLPLLPCRRR